LTIYYFNGYELCCENVSDGRLIVYSIIYFCQKLVYTLIGIFLLEKYNIYKNNVPGALCIIYKKKMFVIEKNIYKKALGALCT